MVMVIGCAILIAGICGCGESPQAISGRATLDGQPLSEAAIQFIPKSPGVRKTSCEVQSGAYQLPQENGLVPGEYRVDLVDLPPLSHSTTPRRPFPARYTDSSPLSITVEPQGPRTFDFALTSEP
jgi:hypothetical protein